MRGRLPIPIELRFWTKVNKTGECWEWTAAKGSDGYGQIGGGPGRGMREAHRVSYEMEYGPIPEGLVIDHVCHVRACVRPSHLRAVSHKENLENRAGSYSSTGVRGVYPSRAKFQVVVGHNGKQRYVGTYETLAEAEAAAIAKRNELYADNVADRRDVA